MPASTLELAAPPRLPDGLTIRTSPDTGCRVVEWIDPRDGGEPRSAPLAWVLSGTVDPMLGGRRLSEWVALLLDDGPTSM